MSNVSWIGEWVDHQRRKHNRKSVWQKMHIDGWLLTALLFVLTMGLIILYSAANGDLATLNRQIIRILMALGLMVLVAQISPSRYRTWAPFIFGIGLFLLVAVLLIGHIGKGAQRWLDLGLFRFQPGEIMKLAVPLMLAWYLGQRPLPPSLHDFSISSLIIAIPALLVAKQPDLGTGLVIAAAGGCVILLSGVSWRWLGLGTAAAAIATPLLWHVMHDYQRARVLTFLNPERDPLGTGYHIIQSKIAIGSGGFFGKGFFLGSQAHLAFLPEHATDFIFAVCGEELGFLGSALLIIGFSCIVARGFYIAVQATDTFSRLLAGSLTLTFFISFFINIGMVTGTLPVVGLPLPLVSYGGTSMLMLITGLGMLMSIETHKKLIAG